MYLSALLLFLTFMTLLYGTTEIFPQIVYKETISFIGSTLVEPYAAQGQYVTPDSAGSKYGIP